MREISLTQGRVAIVDEDDFECLSRYTWRTHKDSKGHVCARNSRDELMHRLITNCPRGMVVDHINHNTLDNRKENLRVCTNAQNMMNGRKSKSESLTSKHKGVCYDSKKGWRAQIAFSGKKYDLGSYRNEIDAAKAYNNKAKELFGEFALLNSLEALKETKP